MISRQNKKGRHAACKMSSIGLPCLKILVLVLIVVFLSSLLVGINFPRQQASRGRLSHFIKRDSGLSAPTVVNAPSGFALISQTVSCADTEPLQNPTLRGVVTRCVNNFDAETGKSQLNCDDPPPQPDSCVDGKVVQYSCTQNKAIVADNPIDCESGYECVEGACKPGRCSDSDGGGIYQAWMKGAATDNRGGKAVDTCSSTTEVAEGVCKDGQAVSALKTCDALRGSETIHGQCLAGQCFYACDYKAKTGCPDHFMCSAKNVCVPVKECAQKSDCPGDSNCINNICVKVIQCIDSDPKNNPYILGGIWYTAKASDGVYQQKIRFDECDLSSQKGSSLGQYEKVIDYMCSIEKNTSLSGNQQILTTAKALDPIACPVYTSPNGYAYKTTCQAVPLSLALSSLGSVLDSKDLPLPSQVPNFLSMMDQEFIGKCVIACATRQDCPLFMSCNATLGACVPVQMCQATADCKTGGVCNTQLRMCVDCLSNTDCKSTDPADKSTYACKANTCLKSCAVDADCGGNGICLENICAPATRCDANTPCPSGQKCSKSSSANGSICVPNVVVPLKCNTVAECPAGYDCRESIHTCVPKVVYGMPCQSGSDCRDGYYCEPNTSMCVPYGVVNSCSSDTQCQSTEYCYKAQGASAGLCVPKEVQTMSCVDTDAQNRTDVTGLVYSGKASSSNKTASVKVIPDRCCDPSKDSSCPNNNVVQYSCDAQYSVVENAPQSCAEGSFCSSGRCAQCTDTDPNNDPSVKGTVLTLGGKFEDVCTTVSSLTQWNCGPQNKPLPIISQCPSGKKCSVSKGICE